MRHALETLRQDILYALRQLRQHPGFALTAIVMLSLGLGGNAAIFSVVNAVLLQPSPFRDPGRLTALFERDVIGHDPFNFVAPANYLDWRRDARSFEQIAATNGVAFNLAAKGQSFTPERVDGAFCSDNLFATLGVEPVIGRVFRREEDRPGAPHTAIISWALWQTRFGGAGDILRRQIRLDDVNYDIVGVMPRSFSFPARRIQVWVPMEPFIPPEVLMSHSNHMVFVVGRLRPGISVEQGRAEIDGMVRRYKAQHPEEVMGKGGNVVSLDSYLVKGVRTSLLVLLAAVGCVLLIVCFNLANLLLTRAIGRQREIAIRAAVGATRAQVIRQLLAESAVLSLLSGIGGLLLAAFATDWLSKHAPDADHLPQVANIHVNAAVFLFTFLLALVTGLAAGLFPALQISRSDLVNCLKEGGRSSTPGRTHRHYRDILIACEIGVSLVLLVAAGLLMRSFSELRNVHTGVRADHMLTMAISIPEATYKDRAQVAAFYRQLAPRLQDVPGVKSAGIVDCTPVGGHCSDFVFDIEGRPMPPGKFLDALYRAADPGYFQAAGIPVLKGRVFNEQDGAGYDEKRFRPDSVVISESMAKQFFPNEDPVGKRITLGFEAQVAAADPSRGLAHYQVIGVVGDVLKNPDATIQPTMYVPLLDGRSTDVVLVLHTTVDPYSVTTAARRAIATLDPDLPVYQIRTIDDIIGVSTKDRQFSFLLTGLFAGLALLLAAIGQYGVLSFAVSQRKGEIGIRMALGAAAGEVRTLILKQGMKPAAIGIAIGIFAAFGITRLLRSMLFGVGSEDPLTFAAVTLLLASIATLACMIPAVRATRIDPKEALRSE